MHGSTDCSLRLTPIGFDAESTSEGASTSDGHLTPHVMMDGVIPTPRLDAARSSTATRSAPPCIAASDAAVPPHVVTAASNTAHTPTSPVPVPGVVVGGLYSTSSGTRTDVARSTTVALSGAHGVVTNGVVSINHSVSSTANTPTTNTTNTVNSGFAHGMASPHVLYHSHYGGSSSAGVRGGVTATVSGGTSPDGNTPTTTMSNATTTLPVTTGLVMPKFSTSAASHTRTPPDSGVVSESALPVKLDAQVPEEHAHNDVHGHPVQSCPVPPPLPLSVPVPTLGAHGRRLSEASLLYSPIRPLGDDDAVTLDGFSMDVVSRHSSRGGRDGMTRSGSHSTLLATDVDPAPTTPRETTLVTSRVAPRRFSTQPSPCGPGGALPPPPPHTTDAESQTAVAAVTTALPPCSDTAVAQSATPRTRREEPVVSVYDPDFKDLLAIPVSQVFHRPHPCFGVSRLVLCRNFVLEQGPDSCSKGARCKFVHADTTNVTRSSIHVNYAWRSLELCSYARLAPGDLLRVLAPNERQPSEWIPSERVLVTRGSVNWRQHSSPLSHCAHYYFNRMCNRGERCSFIHAVHVDPTVQGDFKRAPAPMAVASVGAKHGSGHVRSGSSSNASSARDHGPAYVDVLAPCATSVREGVLRPTAARSNSTRVGSSLVELLEPQPYGSNLPSPVTTAPPLSHSASTSPALRCDGNGYLTPTLNPTSAATPLNYALALQPSPSFHEVYTVVRAPVMAGVATPELALPVPLGPTVTATEMPYVMVMGQLSASSLPSHTSRSASPMAYAAGPELGVRPPPVCTSHGGVAEVGALYPPAPPSFTAFSRDVAPTTTTTCDAEVLQCAGLHLPLRPDSATVGSRSGLDAHVTHDFGSIGPATPQERSPRRTGCVVQPTALYSDATWADVPSAAESHDVFSGGVQLC